jgi:protoheme IX farnesyltransferase
MNQALVDIKSPIKVKVQSFIQLMKLRLSFLVNLSAVVGFVFGSKGSLDFKKLVVFSIGGLLVTFSSNAINQYIERDSDKLMDRTKNRPLPTNTLSVLEAILFIGISAIVGILLLTFEFNSTTGLLAALSLIIYGFIYTPLKKVSSIAVFIGAFPGALPPLLGYVAATGTLNMTALWLFLIQFFWQFPHFWSIAWVIYDDYLKANIMLLPSRLGKDQSSAFIIMIYTIVLIPLTCVSYYFKLVSPLATSVILVASILFSLQSFRLFLFNTDKEAKRLMFFSFLYLLVFLFSLFI